MQTAKQRPHTIVTGGAGGIGSAPEEQLLARGHHRTCFDLAPHPDDQVYSVIIDVTDEQADGAAIDKAARSNGTITALVACHGLRSAFIPALEMDVEHLRRRYDLSKTRDQPFRTMNKELHT